MPKTKVKQDVVIIGGGGHARILREILGLDPHVRVLGYTDLKPCLGMQVPYLGKDIVLKKMAVDRLRLVNGVGSVAQPLLRQKVYEHLTASGFKFMSVIHPRAVISKETQLGQGVQVMAAAVINLGARLGENVIINTSSVIEHDVFIGAHTHIAPRVAISGGADIGEGVHVGIGATIIQGIKVGDGALIAAGAVVIKNVDAKACMAGVPAKRMA
jgi:UDP-perosamine 4-acetyltransferase